MVGQVLERLNGVSCSKVRQCGFALTSTCRGRKLAALCHEKLHLESVVLTHCQHAAHALTSSSVFHLSSSSESSCAGAERQQVCGRSIPEADALGGVHGLRHGTAEVWLPPCAPSASLAVVLVGLTAGL